MALTRPILLSVPSFDATVAQTFTFTAPGVSAQIVANQITIRTQNNNTIVYQQQVNSFKYENTVPAGTLTNGTYYNATIIAIDAQGNQSPASLPIQFWCYSAPSLTFTNIPDNNVINNASFNFEFTYSQSEGEALNSYIVNLYNVSQVVVSTSSTVYVQDGTPPYSGSYLFSGFSDNATYYIQITGQTVNGATVQTPLTQLNINYITPDLFSLIVLTNNCDEGYITVTSNIQLMAGSSNPSPPIYINNDEVDLTQPGSYVEWTEGYNINGDYLARLWFRNPTIYSTIAQFSNASGQTITINYMEGYENVDSEDMQAYIEVYVNSVEGMEYYIFSNYIDILPSTQQYNLWLSQINNIFQLQLASVPTS